MWKRQIGNAPTLKIGIFGSTERTRRSTAVWSAKPTSLLVCAAASPSTCQVRVHRYCILSCFLLSNFGFFFLPVLFLPAFLVSSLFRFTSSFLEASYKVQLKKKQLKFQLHTRYEKHTFQCDSTRRLIIPMCTFCTVLENTTVSAPVLWSVSVAFWCRLQRWI